jgi:hypothetical protein
VRADVRTGGHEEQFKRRDDFLQQEGAGGVRAFVHCNQLLLTSCNALLLAV